jgi:hypothetical protein
LVESSNPSFRGNSRGGEPGDCVSMGLAMVPPDLCTAMSLRLHAKAQ